MEAAISESIWYSGYDPQYKDCVNFSSEVIREHYYSSVDVKTLLGDDTDFVFQIIDCILSAPSKYRLQSIDALYIVNRYDRCVKMELGTETLRYGVIKIDTVKLSTKKTTLSKYLALPILGIGAGIGAWCLFKNDLYKEMFD